MIRYLTITFLLLCGTSCATLPKSFQTRDEVIAVGPGPEDMVMDTITEQPRILISCNARRKTEPHYGEIETYYPETGVRKVLKRRGEPDTLSFNPHGIDLVRVRDALILLVVNHEHEKKMNSILRYEVKKDELIFLSQLTHPLISSPNAVSGFPDGTLLVSNDAKKQGNIWEPLLKLKRAQIVFWNGKECTVAAEKFCYSNGIAIKGNKVFLASTRQNKVWQFDFDNGKMMNKQIIARVKGADNIRFDGEDLLVPCHLRFIAFIKHVSDSTKYSPSTVYRINPVTKKASVEYFDSGAQISGASTALMYKHHLYVSGVFDPKMAKTKK